MAQSKKLATNQATTGPGAWHHLHPEQSNRGYTVELGGSAGAAAADVDIEVDHGEGNGSPATRLQFKLVAGTSTLAVPVTNSDVDPNGPFPRVRINVRNLSGGGLVSAAVTAAAPGMGAV